MRKREASSWFILATFANWLLDGCERTSGSMKIRGIHSKSADNDHRLDFELRQPTAAPVLCPLSAVPYSGHRPPTTPLFLRLGLRLVRMMVRAAVADEQDAAICDEGADQPHHEQQEDPDQDGGERSSDLRELQGLAGHDVQCLVGRRVKHFVRQAEGQQQQADAADERNEPEA